MESKKFSEILSAAARSDDEAIIAILSKYMQLINKQSRLNGTLDEDLRQYIILRVIEQIPKFNLPAE